MRLRPAQNIQLLKNNDFAMWWVSKNQRVGVAGKISYCPNPECACTNVKLDTFNIDSSDYDFKCGKNSVSFSRLKGIDDLSRKGVVFELDLQDGTLESKQDSIGRVKERIDHMEALITGDFLEELHTRSIAVKKLPIDFFSIDGFVLSHRMYALCCYILIFPLTLRSVFWSGRAKFELTDLYAPNTQHENYNVLHVEFFRCSKVRQAADDDGVILKFDISTTGAWQPSDLLNIELLHEFTMEEALPLIDLLQKRHPDKHWFRNRQEDVVAICQQKKGEIKRAIKSIPKPESQLGAVNISPIELMSKAEPGRNEPCPCGSGRKFKKCCLMKQV